MHDDYVHSVIKEVSEAEERGSGDESSPVPGGSTDDLESEGIITFTARKPSSEPPKPTAVELQLPWKRDENDSSAIPVIQSEFPLWVNNKEYTHYYSPTNTFLGGLDKNKHPTVVEIFNTDDQPASPAPLPFVTVTMPDESVKDEDHAKDDGAKNSDKDPV